MREVCFVCLWPLSSKYMDICSNVALNVRMCVSFVLFCSFGQTACYFLSEPVLGQGAVRSSILLQSLPQQLTSWTLHVCAQHTHTHTRTHTHTYTHTRARASTHALTHASIPPPPPTHTHVHTHAHTLLRIMTHAPTCKKERGRQTDRQAGR